MRCGHRQNRVRQQRPSELVEHDEFAAARSHGEAGQAEQCVHVVAVQAGSVDHAARPQRVLLGGADHGDVVGAVEFGDAVIR